VKIIVDAMGGDNAPFEIVKGAISAAKEFNAHIILTGRVEEILRCIEKMGLKELPAGVEIANATEVIEMDEEPVMAYRKKKDSSMTVGLNMLKEGQGDAMVSAGSTGALLSGATLVVKRIPGVKRAALAPILPNADKGVMLIDCGANVECTPQYLLQFAYMGSCYTEFVRGIKSPRIGLLNNGTEKTKGTQLQIETYELLEEAHAAGKLNFIGNVEAKDVMHGVCDVVVCDGYSGNVLLKATEGAASFVMKEIKKTLTANIKTKIAALLVKKEVYDLKERMSADKVGGTALLGISKPVIKAHGSSNADAIKSAIRQAITAANSNMAEILEKNIAE
jgi:glycerol-3-phosphate acyltransferase PlsX